VAAFLPGARSPACHSTIPPLPLWLLAFLVPGTKPATVPYHPCRCGCFHSWCQERSLPQYHSTHIAVAACIPGTRNLASHGTIPPMPLWLLSFLVPGTNAATVPDHPCQCGYYPSWCHELSQPPSHTTQAAVAALIPGARNQACHGAIPPMPLWLLSFLVPGT
jgi:hypothetical protein